MTTTHEYNEINSIKYKAKLIDTNHAKYMCNLNKLDAFLENEQKNSKSDSWIKLDNTIKLQKLLIFANKYKEDNALSDDEYNKLIDYFKYCLERNKLQRVKDVIYNKEDGVIESIPILIHDKITSRFTLKNVDKRLSTCKGLSKKNNTCKITNTSIHS